jgi:hypothetical protein
MTIPLRAHETLGTSTRFLVVGAAVVALTAACGNETVSTHEASAATSGHVASDPARTGTLAGHELLYGGPMKPDGHMALEGAPAPDIRVTILRAGRRVASARTDSDGAFSFALPPGDYTVKGCRRQELHVTAGITTTHNQICAVP